MLLRHGKLIITKSALYPNHGRSHCKGWRPTKQRSSALVSDLDYRRRRIPRTAHDSGNSHRLTLTFETALILIYSLVLERKHR